MPPARRYSMILARLRFKDREPAIGLLYQAGLNTFQEVRVRSSLELRIQVPERRAPSSLLGSLHRLEKLHFGRKLFLKLQLQRIRSGRWANDYQKYLKPFVLLPGTKPGSPALRIDPRGQIPDPPRLDTLYIVASLAFGTGTHPTTRLSAEFLVRALKEKPGGTVLDVGCGTGILAMVARRSGSGAVRALDNDPLALEMARDNLAGNQVDRVRLGTQWPPSRQSFDIVVANIERNTLLKLRPSLESRLKPNGQLLLSGLLYRDAEDIARAYTGFRLRERKNKKGWTALWLTRDIRQSMYACASRTHR
jgi:Ribosomal protein L11 methylase